jgi:hypothetical protein
MTRKRPSSSATLSSSTRTVPECATRFARRPCAGSGPDAGIDGEFAMKNLHRDPLRAARRRVDASCPAYADQDGQGGTCHEGPCRRPPALWPASGSPPTGSARPRARRQNGRASPAGIVTLRNVIWKGENGLGAATWSRRSLHSLKASVSAPHRSSAPGAPRSCLRA